jgi:hypothetical protein
VYGSQRLPRDREGIRITIEADDAPAPASSSARACPPSPTVQSTNKPPRSAPSCVTISSTITAREGSYPELRIAVASSSVYGSRCIFATKPIVIPHVEIPDLAEDVDVAGHRRGVAQTHWNEDAALHVELPELVRSN